MGLYPTNDICTLPSWHEEREKSSFLSNQDIEWASGNCPREARYIDFYGQ